MSFGETYEKIVHVVHVVLSLHCAFDDCRQKTATVAEFVAEFGDYSRQCGQGFTRAYSITRA